MDLCYRTLNDPVRSLHTKHNIPYMCRHVQCTCTCVCTFIFPCIHSPMHSFSHAFILLSIHFPMHSFSYAFIFPYIHSPNINSIYTQGITPAMARAKCYHTMDAFMKLVVVLVRYSGDAANTVTKVNLLNKVGTSPCDTRFKLSRNSMPV